MGHTIANRMAAQAPPAMASPSQPDDSLPPYSSSALTTGEALPTPKQELDKKFEVKIDLVPDAADPADPQDWLCTIEFKIHDLEQVMRKGLAWTGANVVRKRGFYNDRLKGISSFLSLLFFFPVRNLLLLLFDLVITMLGRRLVYRLGVLSTSPSMAAAH